MKAKNKLIKNKLPQSMGLVEGNMITFSAKDTSHVMQGGEGGSQKRTFTMVGYTGSPVDRFGGKVIIDLNGMQIPNVVKILRDHDSDKWVGKATEINKTNVDLSLSGFLFPSESESQRIADLNDDGADWEASVGIRPNDAEQLREGDSKEINGRTFHGPGIIITASTLQEVSFVAFGADRNTSAAIFSLDGQINLEGITSNLIEQDKTINIGDNNMSNKSEAVEATEQQEAVTEAVTMADVEGQNEAEAVVVEAQDNLEDINASALIQFTAGFSDGETNERERCIALATHFADRPDFLAEQIGKGHDISKAKSELADILIKENAELKSQSDSVIGFIPCEEDSMEAESTDNDINAEWAAEWAANDGDCQNVFGNQQIFNAFKQNLKA